MAAIHTEALVLRAVDFGESDRIVHLLTPHTGRIAAIAKGARRSRRRFPGTLDFFNRLRVQLERRPRSSLARLEHAALERVYPRLRTETPRFALGCYLLELLDRLAPEGGAASDRARLFGFAVGAFETLDRQPPDLQLRILLELRALEALGLRPELRCCVRCGEPIGSPEAAFHVPDGGPLCAGCRRPGDEVLPVSLGTLRALERGLALDIGALDRLRLDRRAVAEARLLAARFHRFHLGLELRSERFLDGIIGSAGAD
jgi:DNA repair protein RecO (recombination protein O)